MSEKRTAKVRNSSDFEDSVAFHKELAEIRKEEIDRLNRIMPHTGETCKHYDDSGNPFPACKEGGLICYKVDECGNKQWKLKD